MFIPNYSKIAASLTELYADKNGEKRKKNERIPWGPEQQRAFDLLKERMTSGPVLAHFQDDLETRIHVDSSQAACGAVLAQRHPTGLRPVSCCSRKLTKAERGMSTIERECAGLVYSIEKFKPYITERPVTVVTDHHALQWIQSLKSGLTRWATFLAQFELKVIHRSGREHSDADALSRGAVFPPPTTDAIEDPLMILRMASMLHLSRVDLRAEQLQDKFCSRIIAVLERTKRFQPNVTSV